MNSDDTLGLSTENRSFLVGLTFFALLLFGPVEPYGLAVRLAYLAIIPGLTWLALSYCGARMIIDALMNERINRALLAGVAGGLVVGAFLLATAEFHGECTQWVQSSDGTHDCVGDLVPVKGGDAVGALIAIALAAFAFWAAVTDRQV